jgi:drug/metabolite transporter (DMT)-like permease
VLGRLVLGKLSFTTTTALRFTLALPVLLLIVLVQSGGAAFAHYQSSDALPFLGIALIPGFLALLLYYRALRSTPATLATIAEMAYPVAATFIASAPPPYGFNQPLYLPQFIGTALLIAVIFILNYTKERTPPVIVEQEPAA